MTYQRKTRDEYQIHGNYGHGWEEVDAFDTRKEAREILKEYRIAAPYASYKLIVKRIKRSKANEITAIRLHHAERPARRILGSAPAPKPQEDQEL